MRLASLATLLAPAFVFARSHSHVQADGAATIYLHPPPEISHSISLSPAKANAVLVSHLGLAETSDFDLSDADDGVVDGWSTLLRQVGEHPIENVVGAGQPNALVLLLHSDYPHGELNTFILQVDSNLSVAFGHRHPTKLSGYDIRDSTTPLRSCVR